MKTWISFFVICFVVKTFAAAPSTYRIQTEVYVDQALVGAPQIVTMSGKSATVETKYTSSGDFLKLSYVPQVIPQKDQSDSILLQVNFDYKKGLKKMNYSTNLVVKLGEEVQVPVLKNNQGELSYLKLTVATE